MRIAFLTLFLATVSLSAMAQSSPLLERYRSMALNYNHSLQAAEQNIQASMELVRSAQADLKPKLSAGADVRYMGQPLQGSASATLMQPLYTGGRLLENIRMARLHQSLAAHEVDLLHSSICYQTDMQYWHTVAQAELLTVATDYHRSMTTLVHTIGQRVEAGLTDRQDLLMVQVRLDEAQYRLLQAQSNFGTARMALNSLTGIGLSQETEVEGAIPALTSLDVWPTDSAGIRPELLMAQDRIGLARSSAKLTDARFKPQLHVGVDGSLWPGYEVRTAINPQYAVYAKLSVPLFEWGKRRNEKRAAHLQVEAAHQQWLSVADEVRLETVTAGTRLEQAIRQVSLTQSSLEKAQHNERMAQERYAEGKVSVIEVIEATNYRQSAQTHFVEAKVEAQAQYATLLKATNGYVGEEVK